MKLTLTPLPKLKLLPSIPFLDIRGLKLPALNDRPWKIEGLNQTPTQRKAKSL